MKIADQFSALADPTRCRVVELLNQRPMPVHELTAAFRISRPAISRHLRVLKEARLVKEEKRGRENVYALQRARLKPLVEWIERQVPPAEEKAAAVPVAASRKAPRAPVAARSVPPPKVAAAAKPQMQLDLF